MEKNCHVLVLGDKATGKKVISYVAIPQPAVMLAEVFNLNRADVWPVRFF